MQAGQFRLRQPKLYLQLRMVDLLPLSGSEQPLPECADQTGQPEDLLLVALLLAQ